MQASSGAAHLEQTIQSEINFSGVGLHSGAMVTMRLVPAPAGSGIVFRRTDLDNFEIPATGRNVAKVSYATSLMRQSVLIQTTEHLLSALIGCGVDNVIVEVDNLEVPILDGSALPYVQAFQATGLRQQRRRREYLKILKQVEVRDGSKFIGVYPGTGYSIDYSIDFPTPIGCETFRGDLATGDYINEIAPARTFGFKEDEPMLRDMGLIRGASEACAIILTRTGILNGPLRFHDEFVRHKVLDLIGDLALAGRRIQGRVVAERAGHAMHTALVQRLMRDRSAWELAHGYDQVLSPRPSGRSDLFPHMPNIPGTPSQTAPSFEVGSHTAAIALGSNLPSRFGAPEQNLREAIERIRPLGRILAISNFLTTAPVGYTAQPDFINGALLLETTLAPLELLRELLAIEQAMGRTRDGVPAKGPRMIDLDLIFVDDLTMATEELTLPHPAMAERAFVLSPLAEIAPDWDASGPPSHGQ